MRIQFLAEQIREVARKRAQARFKLAALCHVAKQELTRDEMAELRRLLRDTSPPTSRIDH
jgi:hypothetical protein